jgi:MOSC domain-containing protein YiiM
MSTPQILSLRVGLPKDVPIEGGTLYTGLLKQEVPGEVQLDLRGLQGDGWADLVHHGLEDQGICAYPVAHYRWLSQELGLPELNPGAFGENLVLSGQDEAQVYVGDRYSWGVAELEVTKARKPCAILNQVWNCSRLAAQMSRGGYTGWYFRVLRAGVVSADSRLELISRDESAETILQQWRRTSAGE